MQVLQDHLGLYNSTVIIKGNIIFDSVITDMREFKLVYKQHDVPEEIFNEVVEAYNKDSELEECNIHKYLDSEDGLARRCIAQYGDDSHRDALINDKEEHIKMDVAEYGNDSHRDALLLDESPLVRWWAKDYYEGCLEYALVKTFFIKALRKIKTLISKTTK